MSPAPPFCYEGFDLDPGRGLLTCRYSLGERDFAEKITFDPAGSWDAPGVAQAARLTGLLAGVSYYKTAAPSVVDLGQVPVTVAELEFLRTFYLDGLGEFAYRNDLDLSALRFVGGNIGGPVAGPAAGGPRPGSGDPRRAMLIPFGGGIDSIVTVELMRGRGDAALLLDSVTPFRSTGTNLYYLQQLLSYAQQDQDPQALQAVGEVLDDIDGLSTGDRVVLSSVLSCATRGLELCKNCRAGAFNRCDAVTTGFDQVGDGKPTAEHVVD